MLKWSRWNSQVGIVRSRQDDLAKRREDAEACDAKFRIDVD
jgi:hypothetical protein